MRIPISVRTLLVAIVLAVAAGVPVPAQDAGELFDATVLHEIKLSISTRDLQQLRDTYQDNTYYAADIQWRDLKVRNVGIRSRGRSTRAASKLGLQVDFNRYVTGQRFLGMKALVLDNLWQDPSMVREQVAMAFFARMGLPAPRVSFAKLYINNEFQGVYGIVEAIDSVFAQRAFGESEGFLFEYKQQPMYNGAYLGDELDPYKQLFEPRTREKQPDVVLYEPFRNLFREISQPRDPVWPTRVAEYLDLEQLVKYVAVETYLADDDGFLGANGMSNFYVYRSDGSNVHRLIPWDKDLTFAEVERPLLTRLEDNELFRRLMAYRAGRVKFYQHLAAMAASAHEEDWLKAQLTQSVSLIAEAAKEDTLKPYAEDATAEALRTLRQFVRFRSRYVRTQLKELRDSNWAPSYWDASERQ